MRLPAVNNEATLVFDISQAPADKVGGTFKKTMPISSVEAVLYKPRVF